MNKMPGSLPNPGNEHSSLQISIKRYNIKAYEHSCKEGEKNIPSSLSTPGKRDTFTR
jgi:hypothetical protein